jgi:hypothetical protein
MISDGCLDKPRSALRVWRRDQLVVQGSTPSWDMTIDNSHMEWSFQALKPAQMTTM